MFRSRYLLLRVSVIAIMFSLFVSDCIADDNKSDGAKKEKAEKDEAENKDKKPDDRMAWTPIRFGLWDGVAFPDAKNVGPLNFSVFDDQDSGGVPENITGLSVALLSHNRRTFGMTCGFLLRTMHSNYGLTVGGGIAMTKHNYGLLIGPFVCGNNYALTIGGISDIPNSMIGDNFGLKTQSVFSVCENNYGIILGGLFVGSEENNYGFEFGGIKSSVGESNRGICVSPGFTTSTKNHFLQLGTCNLTGLTSKIRGGRNQSANYQDMIMEPSTGVQLGILNWVRETNNGENLKGSLCEREIIPQKGDFNCQVGVFNYSEVGSGFQLGVLNYNSKGFLPWFPFFNF